jgi:hypothetical protein
MLLTEERFDFIQQSCWVSISHQEDQVTFSHSFSNNISCVFCSMSALQVEWMGRQVNTCCFVNAGLQDMFSFLFLNRAENSAVFLCVSVYVHVCVCVCGWVCTLVWILCGVVWGVNKEENRPSSVDSNNGQVGNQAFLTDIACMSLMTHCTGIGLNL